MPDPQIDRIVSAVRRVTLRGIEDGVAAMSEHTPDGALSGEMLLATAILLKTFGKETAEAIIQKAAASYTPEMITEVAWGLSDPKSPGLYHDPKTDAEYAEAVAFMLCILYNDDSPSPVNLDEVKGKGRFLVDDGGPTDAA